MKPGSPKLQNFLSLHKPPPPIMWNLPTQASMPFLNPTKRFFHSLCCFTQKTAQWQEINDYLIAETLSSVSHHEAEIHQLFGISSLWDAIHDTDRIIRRYLALYEIFVFDRIGSSSSSGRSRIVKAIPNVHNQILMMALDEIRECPELIEIRMQAQLAMEASCTQSNQPARAFHISEPSETHKSEVVIQTSVQPKKVSEQPEEVPTKSPSPNDQEVEEALRKAQITADQAAADSFLNLSSPSESTPAKTSQTPAAPVDKETPAADTTAEVASTVEVQIDEATTGTIQAEAPLPENVTTETHSHIPAETAAYVFEEIQVDQNQPEVILEEVADEVPHAEVPHIEVIHEEIQGDASTTQGPTFSLGPYKFLLDTEEVESPLHSEDDEPGVDPRLQEQIKAWKRAPPSNFSFSSTGNDKDDLVSMRAIIEAQAATINEQQHEITGLKLHSIKQAQTLVFWKNKFKEVLEEQIVRINILENSFHKYIKEKKEDATNYPFLKQKVELYHQVQENNFEMATQYYDDIAKKLKALPSNPINVADLVAKALKPIEEKVNSLESQVVKIPDLEADIKDLLYHLDDAKKGEGYTEEYTGFAEDQLIEDKVAKEMQVLQAAVRPPPHCPERSQVSAEYQTSRHQLKRQREDEVQSSQVKKRLYTEDRRTTLPTHITKVDQKLLPQQDLKLFGDKELLVSHKKKFSSVERWIPVDLNDWYEGQKEVFIKWYHVFANISRNQVTEAEAWKYFLFYHAHKDQVRKLKEAASKAGIKDIPHPSYKVVSPPMTGKSVSTAEIEFELKTLASILGLPQDPKNEGFKALKQNLYKVYGQRF